MWKGPIASAHVVIYNTDGVMADGYTDETGRFLAPLSEGVYGVTVEAKGYKGYGFEIFVKPDSSNEFEAPMDKDAILGKLGVMAYALTTHVPGTVPVPGATVEIYNSMGELVATGKTDEYGLYIVNIAPDAYNLIITSPDFAPSKTSAVVAVNEATQLYVEMKK
jgi:hypothetical protein